MTVSYPEADLALAIAIAANRGVPLATILREALALYLAERLGEEGR